MIENLSKDENENRPDFPGKIAVVTSAITTCEDDFYSAEQLVIKYGADKIIHAAWPDDFMNGQKQITDTVVSLAADREIKALIINQAYDGTNAAVEKFKETRDDVFIVYCSNQEPLDIAVSLANLLLEGNEEKIGRMMVEQAKKQGAKVFVHYSFPRQMLLEDTYNRYLNIKETCSIEGLQFIDATALDPAGGADVDKAKQFIFEDVCRLVAKYGEDTAFFCTNCALQAQLIKAVIENHAIYPQPCCPSIYHGFTEALGIQTGEGQADLSYLISEASRLAANKNMTDRLSTWPVSASMMYTNVAAEYAIKWIKGEVPKTGIDDRVLVDCINAYIIDVVGEESHVFIDSYSMYGTIYNNYKLILMGYLDL